jgi:Tfp pilus assembly protein FimT
MAIMTAYLWLNRLPLKGNSRFNPQGTTLAETLIAIVLAGILTTVAAATFNYFFSEPFPSKTNRIASQFRVSRARAIGQTSAYRIRATSTNQFTVERANICSATTWVRDPAFIDEDLQLSSNRETQSGLGVQLSEARINNTLVSPVTNWSICYDSRGITNTDLRLTFRETRTNKTMRVQVFAGGGVQVYDN